MHKHGVTISEPQLSGPQRRELSQPREFSDQQVDLALDERKLTFCARSTEEGGKNSLGLPAVVPVDPGKWCCMEMKL